MAEITAAAVKKLRDRTDLPMMDCKKALTEAGGDEEKAIEWLRARSKKKLEDRAGNVTAEGRVFQWLSDDGTKGCMIEVCCEQEPVAGSPDLIAFGEALLKVLVENEAVDSVEALMQQPHPDGSGTFAEAHEELTGKLREKIVVSRVARAEGLVGGYVHHNFKTGVLFVAEGEKGDAEILRGISMHIAGLKPAHATPDDLDAEAVTAEREKLTEQAKASGKPENIVEKIVDGRMKAFYVESGVLTAQPFAMDDTKTVSQALAEKGLSVKGFDLFAIGS
ncbi:MAG: translation elongation factor Ts [Planctomycetota bacterium]